MAAFLSTLHWPASGVDLGVGGVSHVDLLIFHELWAGEKLDFEKAILPRGLDQALIVGAPVGF